MSASLATPFDVLRDFYAGLVELLYPSHCTLCGLLGAEWICSACLTSLIVPVPEPYCLRCGQIQLTRECLKCAEYPSGLIRCRAAGRYTAELAAVIHRLKYRHQPSLAVPLGSIISDLLMVRSELYNNLQFDAIVPIPLHKSRLRERGYNQSERLANVVSNSLGIPADTQAISRIRKTAQQVGKQRRDRLTNLSDAFMADPRRCKNKVFLLIDDVTTTGTTISECARHLLDAGASRVYSVTVAAG